MHAVDGAVAHVEIQGKAPEQKLGQSSTEESAAIAGQQLLRQCRLCLEEDSVTGLVSCCGCTGSIKYIHARWDKHKQQQQ
jgi:hypothetical protein